MFKLQHKVKRAHSTKWSEWCWSNDHGRYYIYRYDSNGNLRYKFAPKHVDSSEVSDGSDDFEYLDNVDDSEYPSISDDTEYPDDAEESDDDNERDEYAVDSQTDPERFDADQSGPGELVCYSNSARGEPVQPPSTAIIEKGSSVYIQVIGDTSITYTTNYTSDRNTDDLHTTQKASKERYSPVYIRITGNTSMTYITNHLK